MSGLSAIFLFDPNLRPLLRLDRRSLAELLVEFNGTPAVKHLVEALGVPHTEVGTVLRNGSPAGLAALVHPGDRVEVGAVPDGAGTFAQPGEPRFIADNHLGRLAAYLRMLGFDTLYHNHWPDDELARLAAAEGRVLLSRDRRLLMRRSIVYGCCLRSLQPSEQLGEVVRRYRLAEQARPFRRCLRCNQELRPASKAEVFDQLEPLTKLYFDEFALCPNCGQVYWKGSHYERMLAMIQRLM